jgi:hypothetical protein
MMKAWPCSGCEPGPLFPRAGRAQQAYEADVRRRPRYHDKTPRPPWKLLDKLARWSWEKGELEAFDSRGDRL